jgi:O-antigen/teichoic acid export membrane protein
MKRFTRMPAARPGVTARSVMRGLLSWLQQQRSSTRLAFLLQTASRLATAALTLLWTRLLLQAMGVELNGLWLAFQAVATLGGLGDLGMGGAVNIRTGRLLGQSDEVGLQKFLASARALFLLLAAGSAFVVMACSPWLPGWLELRPVAGSGSLPLLLALAGLGFIPIILHSYIGNVNYACGNLLWPIVPAFLLSQGALASHCLLAQSHAPLWLQYLPYTIAGALSMLLIWWFVRVSHPSLAGLLPLRFRWSEWRQFAGESFWMYLWGLGCAVNISIDRVAINAGFGAGLVPSYHNNYKVCELALFAISGASFAAMPKITRWLAAAGAERARGVEEVLRLNRVQILLSCTAALVYLAVNDLFIRIWFAGVGDFRVPLSWQYAFALSLAITGASDAAVQVSPRCCDRGLRVSGLAVGLTALLKVALTYVAMKAGSILGIALATVAAQSFLTLSMSRFVCRELNLPWGPWFLRTWLLPVGIISLAFAARSAWSWTNATQAVLLLALNAMLLVAAGWASGIKADFIREELKIVAAIFRKRR